MIAISGYLTEAKLAEALQQLVPDGWLGNEVANPGTSQRWDMAYRRNGQLTVVEYDGDEHYRHSIKIKIDRAKDDAAGTLGYQVVRFPYWVQLDNATVRHYFALEAETEQSFPHGFITTKLFPDVVLRAWDRTLQGRAGGAPVDRPRSCNRLAPGPDSGAWRRIRFAALSRGNHRKVK